MSEKVEKMSKGVKYTIIGLVVGAVVLVALCFIFGNKSKEYTIIFDSDGGSHVASQVVKEGDRLIKPETPTKEGYLFSKWEYQEVEYDFTKTVTSDMTLKAIWGEAEEKEKYDVSFVVNGKTKTINVSEITENDLEELGFEEKSGYVIKWYVNGKEYDTSTSLTGNITITGKYEKVTTYTVKFNSDGGTSVSSQTVKPNEKAKEPENVTKNGFILEGWYLNNNKYDFDTEVTKNITLIAKWSEDPAVKRYEVTFDSDGGTEVTKQRVIEGDKATEPKAPTKKDHTFIGWYNGDQKYDFKTKVTKDISLKAKWEKSVQYTVTFDKNNGSANETKTVTGGEKVTRPSDPTKDGSKFAEWLLDNKTFDFDTPITKDITLVARYDIIKKYTVTFNSNGGSSVASQTVTEGSTATEPSRPTRNDYDFVEWRLNGVKYVFSTKVTKDIELVAEWKEKEHSYKVIATKADAMASPDSLLKFYKDNVETSFKEIQDSDGNWLCNGSNPYTPTANLDGETFLWVVLNDNSNDNSKVKATLVK